jgi:hypothetical protein
MKPSLPTSSPTGLVLAVLAALALGYPGQVAAARQAPTAKSFEGVWKVTKVVRMGPNPGTDTHPQPSLAIYSRGYYSILRDNSSGPRQSAPMAKDPARLTDAEKIAKYEEWAPYNASGGTYEVKGDKLITHNVVAKQVGGTTATEVAIFKFVGDTYIVRPAPAPGAPAGEVVERTYTRVR